MQKNLFGEPDKIVVSPHIPYMGNKRCIAKKIVSLFPSCSNFLDACCGGGVIGYTMQLNGLCARVTMNDYYKPLVELHEQIRCGNLQIDYEYPEFVDRRGFFDAVWRIRDGRYSVEDVLIKYIYSFGNSGGSYLYGRAIEEFKQQIHEELMREGGTKQRLNYIKGKADGDRNMPHLESLQKIEKLQNIRLPLTPKFTSDSVFEMDYSDYDLIYFDIPYRKSCNAKKGTGYEVKFDHEAFGDMFRGLKVPAFQSEYSQPQDIKEIAVFDKISCWNEKRNIAQERVFWNGIR